MIFPKPLFCFSLTILLVSSINVAVASDPFVDSCERLAAELRKVQNIEAEVTRSKKEDGSTVEIINFENRAKYIEDNIGTLISAFEGVKESASRSNRRYRDDAEFIEIVGLVALSYPHAKRIDQFESKAVDFIDSSRSIHLEDETKKLFMTNRSFSFFIDDKAWDSGGQEVVGNLIRASDYRSIFIQAVIKLVYLDRLDVEKAWSFYESHRDSLQPEHQKYLEEFIVAHEEHFKAEKR